MLIDLGWAVFRIVFEGLFSLTGEIVLFVVSFGKRKPRWDLYVNERPLKFYVFNELSMYIGIVTWLILLVSIKWVIFQ